MGASSKLFYSISVEGRRSGKQCSGKQCSRLVSELTVGVVDSLLAVSGTAAFNTSHPLQRAWRDIHFMSMHSAVNAEKNFAPFAHMEFGLGRPVQSLRV